MRGGRQRRARRSGKLERRSPGRRLGSLRKSPCRSPTSSRASGRTSPAGWCCSTSSVTVGTLLLGAAHQARADVGHRVEPDGSAGPVPRRVPVLPLRLPVDHAAAQSPPKRRRSAYKKLVGRAGREAARGCPGPVGHARQARPPRRRVPGHRRQRGRRSTTTARPAFDAMLEAIRAAKHHVHIQFFIFRSDASGQRFIDALCECASRGVEVRFLYDSVGSYNLSRSLLRKLT